MTSKLIKIKQPNPVAVNAKKFCRATVETDRKKASKRGFTKHKGEYNEH